MILTIDLALKVLPIVAKIILKAVGVLKGGDPTSIEEELIALEECRLRPSEDIIKEADDNADSKDKGNSG